MCSKDSTLSIAFRSAPPIVALWLPIPAYTLDHKKAKIGGRGLCDAPNFELRVLQSRARSLPIPSPPARNTHAYKTRFPISYDRYGLVTRYESNNLPETLHQRGNLALLALLIISRCDHLYEVMVEEVGGRERRAEVARVHSLATT